MKRAPAIGLVLPCLLLVVITSHAQKQDFTFEQIFKNSESNVTKQLPVVQGWADDTHYLLAQKEADGQSAVSMVDVKTGKSVPYPNVAIDQLKPTVAISGAVNLTLSPDKKWAAYTLSLIHI